ncbi:hypothetical protein CLSAB_19360 [Clostridium saccharobutylicum]|uniref:phage coat protein n=1 Tax=Clostridium saccharobutylicum TaxID=169679 RepID=UPI00098C717A|nr:phage coat protein [Clostridium saccharobutylicum]OOM17216.1 hypothetical protein CLSAB_19360 [Clostridium saccharobutylicum]
MPGIFDNKIFNAEVFGQYVERIPNLKQNQLIKSGALRARQDIATLMQDQTGGNLVSIPFKGLISGQAAQNYDGKTDINSNSTKTFLHKRIVTGRANSWTETDFAADIAGGQDFMANVADQISDYWQEIDQKTLISTLKGVFNMSTGDKNKEFVSQHTVDVTTDATNAGKIGATTVNTAMQKALGDNKSKFSLVCMHSVVSTNLENLKLLDYLKYTDATGLQRDLGLGTLHGRLVLIDDDMPSSQVYIQCVSGDLGALKVVASGAANGQINLADVKPTLNGYTPATDQYVKLATAYTSYILGQGAIEFTNAGAKVPYESYRDPKTNGGQDTLYSRQRKCFAPAGISFTASNMASLSPSDAELENGSNWELVNSQGATDKEYIAHKSIPIAQLISLG